MRLMELLKVSALAAAVTLAATAPSFADDDEDCDAMLKELKSVSDQFIKANEPKGTGPVCFAVGQVLGMLKSARVAVTSCYDEGAKLKAVLASFDEGIKTMEEQGAQGCK